MWFYVTCITAGLAINLMGYHPDIIACLAAVVPLYFLGSFVEGFMK